MMIIQQCVLIEKQKAVNYITLTFANGKFISVNDNDLNIVECDETEYYLKLSPNSSQFG